MRTLYVCPRAHCPGHYSDRTKIEVSSLTSGGVDVELLTFKGLIDGTVFEGIKQHIVVKPNSVADFLFSKLENLKLINFVCHFLEQSLTVLKAVYLYKKRGLRFIHLLNGDPYLFIVFLLGLFFKDTNWAITMIGPYFAMAGKSVKGRSIFLDGFRTVQASTLWKTVYRRAMAKNGYLIIGHDEPTVAAWKSFMGGLFDNRTILLRWGYEPVETSVSGEEARARLGLSIDKNVFLVFGLIHNGKDPCTVVRAIKNIPDITVIQAGFVPAGLLGEIEACVAECGVEERYTIINRWISESDKIDLFCAADAVIMSYKPNSVEWPSIIWSSCSFKRPVIVSESPAVGDYIKQFPIGLSFKVSDPASLAEAIRNFLGLNQREMAKFERNCAKVIQDSSTDNAVRRWITARDNLLNDKSLGSLDPINRGESLVNG